MDISRPEYHTIRGGSTVTPKFYNYLQYVIQCTRSSYRIDVLIIWFYIHFPQKKFHLTLLRQNDVISFVSRFRKRQYDRAFRISSPGNMQFNGCIIDRYVIKAIIKCRMQWHLARSVLFDRLLYCCFTSTVNIWMLRISGLTPGPEVVKNSCSTQLSKKYFLLINVKYSNNR